MAIVRNQHNQAQERAKRLLRELSLDEKIGQLVQVEGGYGDIPSDLRKAIAKGSVGSVINEVDPSTIHELQRIAREDGPHGIPLLMGRDVVHGFCTVFPIPLGMAATWNHALVEQAAAMSAHEASQQGINWTFSPMLDVSRDPRWGRIAESFGEDPLLTADFGAAMVRGYQNGSEHQLVSCLKHFVGYGACESGKDYNTTNIADIELHNVHLPPFKACIDAGALSVMPSFSDLNGMPPSGNAELMRDLLRDQWGFEGLVISDWLSIAQLVVHGVAENEVDAARQGLAAGINMDMVSGVYLRHAKQLIDAGMLSEALLDALALEVLAVKFQAGLFDSAREGYHRAKVTPASKAIALRMARESIVLLKNESATLPIAEGRRVCLLGPMADQADEQLGTWVFDADVEQSLSLRQALEEKLGAALSYAPVLRTTRDQDEGEFVAALDLAKHSDLVILAIGEEAILSGEAHCRSELGLPGAQSALVRALVGLGKPLVVVVMAGRPLAIPEIDDSADAILYAWHPGSMAGPGLVDVLYGEVDAMGRLPVTLPRSVGQVPIYYAHGHTGKPVTPETLIRMEDIDAKAPQTSVGNTSFHLDIDPSPLYPFGFGLSYTKFCYSNTSYRADKDSVEIKVDVTNSGSRRGREVVQLYVRDVVASATRPVRELKGYRAIELAVNETQEVRFELSRADLGFHNGRQWGFEPGRFRAWVGASSEAELELEFVLE